MVILLDNGGIILRLLTAAILGSIVGYERESTGQDAGFRTHILVCVGSAIFTIIQLEAAEWVAQVTLSQPELVGVLSSDVTRLTAQIVSGIGFLGAGTIIVTNRAVKGLTTAASIWAIASIGLAAGVGHYFLAFTGTAIILIVLRLLQKILHIEDTQHIHIKYRNRDQTLPEITDFFNSHKIRILRIEFNIDLTAEDGPVADDTFVVGMNRERSLDGVIKELIQLPHLEHVSTAKTTSL